MRSRVRFDGEEGRQVLTGLPGYGPSAAADSNSIGSERSNIRLPQSTDTPSVQQSIGFRIEDALNFSRDPMFNQIKSGDRAPVIDILGLGINKFVGSQTVPPQRGLHTNPISIPGVPIEYWGESNMAYASPRTDSSTNDTDDRNQRVRVGQLAVHAASDSSDRSKEKTVDQKVEFLPQFFRLSVDALGHGSSNLCALLLHNLRRLAQNREAARKSRLRKKAYVQQLESSRLKLTQLEQEQQRARQQGIFISSSGDQSHQNGGNGALSFDVEYSRLLEEHSRRINELRSAVNSHVGDTELRIIVDNVVTQFDEIYRLKGNAVKAYVFHILSGLWKTPAERCFMWIGGFRSSELLKLLVGQLEPLTEQQLVAVYDLQQSSQQAEDALSQGMEALQQSLAKTLGNGTAGSSESSSNVASYMGQMAMAMGKLGTLEGFLKQADSLRQQTMQHMHRILTTRQSARALLAVNDYYSRLRALSSLWLARPREKSEKRGQGNGGNLETMVTCLRCNTLMM